MKYALMPMIALGLLIAPAAAMAASPVGEWRVKDGTAHIRIMDCDKKLWGLISWVSAPDTDRNNPDPAKRNRSVLGMPILLAMQPGQPGRWDGDIYNADNGKTYHGNIRLNSGDSLHVEGCLLGGLLCGGEDWRRLAIEGEENPPCPR